MIFCGVFLLQGVCPTWMKSHIYWGQIFKEFYLLKFQDIQKLQTSQFMFSIRNNSLPIAFQDAFTLNNQILNYNTKSSKLFRVARTQTKLRQFSTKRQSPTTFNLLSNEIKESLSYFSFTKKLKLYLISTYSYI